MTSMIFKWIYSMVIQRLNQGGRHLQEKACRSGPPERLIKFTAPGRAGRVLRGLLGGSSQREELNLLGLLVDCGNVLFDRKNSL
ncbi:MAG: hypothetical protein SCM88_05405 [Bacillota bacterium]|nr:hypothetical protein [Bacillota bacterium]